MRTAAAAAARRGPLVARARGKFKGRGWPRREGRGAAAAERRGGPAAARPGQPGGGHCSPPALCWVGAGSGGRGSSQDPDPQGVPLAAAGCPLPAVPGEPVPVPPPQPGRRVSRCLRLLLGLFHPLLVRAPAAPGEGVSLPGSAIVPAPAVPRGRELGTGSGERDSIPAVTAPGNGKS